MPKALAKVTLTALCLAFGAVALPVSAAVAQTCRAVTAEDYPGKTVRIATHSEFTRSHYPERIAQFAKEPLACGDIVMLGDSLTECHDWSASLDWNARLRNRGISGDTSDGVLARLDEIIAARPRTVILLIGTNDLWTNNSTKKTARNIEAIILALKSGNPQVPLFLQSVFPLRSDSALNTKVRAINAQLTALAAKHGVTLVDTYGALVDAKGLLRSDYTEDGVHLTPAGYKAWVSLLDAKFKGAHKDAASALP